MSPASSKEQQQKIIIFRLTTESTNKSTTTTTMALELLCYYYYNSYFRPAYNCPLLSAEDKKRRDRRTPRIALRRYNLSPFLYMFGSGDDQALLNCCGVDHKVFDELLHMFEPLFDAYTYDVIAGCVRKKN